MVERVLPEYTLPKPTGNWRKDLHTITSQSRKIILQHPWMISISAFRSSVGPNTVRWLELTLNVMNDLGLDIDEMLVISNTLFAFAKGYAAGEIAEQEAAQSSGLSRAQWMASRSDQIRATLNTGKYPMFARVVHDAKAPHDPSAAARGFSLGLDHILDGIEMRVSAGSSSRGKETNSDPNTKKSERRPINKNDPE